MNGLVLSIISRDRWTSGLELSRALNRRLDEGDFMEIASSGDVDVFYDVAEDEYYLRLKPLQAQEPSPEGSALPSVRLPEEPVPKPSFEEELKSAGPDWRDRYEELVKRGLIREVYINGMAFVVSSKLPGESLQHGVHLE
ncbi:hypothetical protein GCM10007981_12620 [Thermocladium modestius]|uniref:Uncharacterized protein n=1 Tax=Thermocladium modestius TaxID=62609 RepID=A0A830GU24_9CREN|nr:hypothetical protein [Thermocladium modestius]GGP21312.1 hypothetical protein GCM10007981_12620 [Thermocladium modestius]